MTYSFNKRLIVLLSVWAFFQSPLFVFVLASFGFLFKLALFFFFFPKFYKVFKFLYKSFFKRYIDSKIGSYPMIREFCIKWFGLRYYSPYPLFIGKRSKVVKNTWIIEIHSLDIRKFFELDLSFVIRRPTLLEVFDFVKNALKTLRKVLLNLLKLFNELLADCVNNFVTNYFVKILLTHIVKITIFLLAIFLCEKLYFFTLEPTNNPLWEYFFEEGRFPSSGGLNANIGSLRYKPLISVSEEKYTKGVLVSRGILFIFIVHSVLGFISLIYDYLFKHVKREDLWLLLVIIAAAYY